MPLLTRSFAELIGTFWLVLGGCGSAVLAAAFPDVGIGLYPMPLPISQRGRSQLGLDTESLSW
jgi:glycerol uptake facilitator-like aquaporin